MVYDVFVLDFAGRFGLPPLPSAQLQPNPQAHQEKHDAPGHSFYDYFSHGHFLPFFTDNLLLVSFRCISRLLTEEPVV